MKNPFILFGNCIYNCCKILLSQKKQYARKQQLQKLFPIEDGEKKAEEFLVKKLALGSAVIFIGIGFVICVILCSRNKSILTDGALLSRNENGAGDYSVELQASVGEWTRNLAVVVHERQYSKEEITLLREEAMQILPNLIKGKNQSLQQVTQQLQLVNSIEGYPFTIEWTSSNHHRISADGTINRAELPIQGEDIGLTATVFDGQERHSKEYKVHLLSEIMSQEEQFFYSLQNEVARIDEKEKSNQQIPLPLRIEGQDILWKEKDTVNYPVLLLYIMLSTWLVCKGMNQELERALNKRKKQLLMDYPECVSKFRLYLSAGLTVKKAFLRIAQDYEQNGDDKRHYLCEEMQVSCYQLENGMSEERVYAEWGYRCQEMKYKQLSYLLTVQIKKGNAQLLELLEREAKTAQEDRQKQAKKLGEEAGVKLLLPMMLMLLIVMLMILLPVWMDFGSI